MKKTILLLLAIILTVTMIPAEIASAVSGPDTPAEVSAERSSYNSITISWQSVSDADGYSVYRATSENGVYRFIKRLPGRYTTSYKNSYLTTGKTYYYKVKAYENVSGKRVYGGSSSYASAKPYMTTPTFAVYNEYMQTTTLIWNAIAGADGYTIYRSTSIDGPYKAFKTRKKSNFDYRYLSKINKKRYSYMYEATQGKLYFYKVRAYRDAENGRVYSASSDYAYDVTGHPQKNYYEIVAYLPEKEGLRFLEILNKERVSRGLCELTWDDELYKYAKVRVANSAKAEFKDGYYSHEPLDKSYYTGLDELGIYNGVAENLARGYGGTKKLFEGWMNSYGHRCCLLDEYGVSSAVAIGFDKRGTMYSAYLTRNWLTDMQKTFEYFD